MKVRLTFLEPVLGTWPSSENIARDYIASKAPDASTIEDEIAALGADAVAEKGKTVFPRTNGQPKEAVLEWLEYGRLRGIGQWRNSGKGRFTDEVLED